MIVLALGSNLGDRETTIRNALHELDAVDGIDVVAASSIIETPALKSHGVDPDAPAYLNAAVEVRTSLDPHALLTVLNRIEHNHGRVRDERWGDRTLDIDIIVFDDLALDTRELTIPHPRAAQRAFVLAPWLELDPHASLGALGSVAGLLATMTQPTPYAAEALK